MGFDMRWKARMVHHRPIGVATTIRNHVAHSLSRYDEIEYRKDSNGNNTFRLQFNRLSIAQNTKAGPLLFNSVEDLVLEVSRAMVHQSVGRVLSMSQVWWVLVRS